MAGHGVTCQAQHPQGFLDHFGRLADATSSQRKILRPKCPGWPHLDQLTAVTRVRIPPGTPTKTKCLAKLRPVTVAHIRKIYGNHGVWSSIFGPTSSAVQLQKFDQICARNGSDRPDLERKLRPTGQQIPFWRFSRESGKSAFEAR
jgi:hypothetical protein